MIFITADEKIDFDDYKYVMKTSKYQSIPQVRKSRQSVIGRDGNYNFTDGFDNKIISVTLTAIDAADITERRANARYLEAVLAKPGNLILDYEKDIFYVANAYKGASVKFNASFDTMAIQFECDCFALSTLSDQIPWEEIEIPWNNWTMPWEGDPSDFTVNPSDVIEINNRGNYEAKPIIKLDGVGDITITHSNGKSLTYTGLNGIINIDTRNLVVYDDSMVNAIGGFTGDFIGLNVGGNTLTITGSFTDVDVEFINKDFFI